MSAGNMWFDERNLPLTFRIKLVKDYPYAGKKKNKKRRKERKNIFFDAKINSISMRVYIYIFFR